MSLAARAHAQLPPRAALTEAVTAARSCSCLTPLLPNQPPYKEQSADGRAWPHRLVEWLASFSTAAAAYFITQKKKEEAETEEK
jgi:hypothetical protein